MASIYKHGRFYWLQWHENGKRFKKSLKTEDKKTARYLKNQFENALALGEAPQTQASITPIQAAHEYIEYARLRLSKKTYEFYRTYTLPFLQYANARKLEHITEKQLTDYINARVASGISQRTANHTIKVIRQFLEWCVKRNYIKANPVKTTKLVKIDVGPPKFLSKAEINAIIQESSGETLEAAVITAIYTGLRMSELFRLTRADIDLKAQTITVRQAKSKRFRVVPIHPDIGAILERAAIPFDRTNERRVFKRIKRKAGLPDIGWHTFRHTFASHLVMSGVDITTVSKLLGHADIATTQIYAHLSDDHVKDSIGKLNLR